MSISERSSVGASDAGANFSTILQRVETGEEITITRDGSPVARLVPMPRVENDTFCDLRPKSSDRDKDNAQVGVTGIGSGGKLRLC